MSFATVYPLYIAKIERKDRTLKELHQVIQWLTGYDSRKLKQLVKAEVTFEEFFQNARLNPKAHLITGSICGVKIETIQDPLMQKVRYLDKLVDELAKGKDIEKILRKE